ncbi:NUDIX hydrolase [Butyrivibrio fibrisolvens]|jgi:8-oxo-dGTP diphosphatase|uniref:8-oxo-dGTP diphosphatase n=1 Tax=Butyrivibrio fibrisolvens TaxID=831 RepID=A0A1H9N4C1_BUTFI|nr:MULTISPECIES: 8-oxo-dGTP diphosphatase [Butyrivibrio]MBQ1457165.1 8-oxo-dGTP diphosphatase [Butyrivibrio sp.]MCR4635105.1 8-oxo-dGTP diphosphatase [Butyrivibrio sp.]PWT27990.1 8-oxo-dGTP diphosphatase [Butyrivibrio fibrisolvens]SER30774.1 8-oxo-dGTP diphosphatase [Butyrivibrio fibrisolvens]
MVVSTLCYLEKDNKYLMLLRNKKEKDVNEGKWIGVGGKCEKGESPEECVIRETFEETGIKLESLKMRGVMTFASEGWEDEYIFVYTSDKFSGHITECNEGELAWIDKDKIMDLNLWDGDRIFLDIMINSDKLFSIKLSYKGDDIVDKQLYVY